MDSARPTSRMKRRFRLSAFATLASALFGVVFTVDMLHGQTAHPQRSQSRDTTEVVGKSSVSSGPHDAPLATLEPGELKLESAERAGALTIAGSLTWDGSQNLHGGVDTERFISRYLLDLSMSADLESLIGWRDTVVFIDFQHHDGTLGNLIVDDFQVFSNIDAPRRTQFPRIWIESKLFDQRLRVKAGKIDANTEFAYTLTGGPFLNSSMGFSPTIFTMPTYPDPAGGFVVDWAASDNRSLRFGFFDGVGAVGVPTGSRLPTTLFSDLRNSFLIFEHDLQWGTVRGGTEGRLAVGGWRHTGRFESYAGEQKLGTGGLYLTADQWLWTEGTCDEHCQQGVAAFFQFGTADERYSQAERHWGSGLTWTGLLPNRDNDILGMGFSLVDFSDSVGTGLTAASESSTEIFYQWKGSDHWQVTSDLQWIRDPGGYAERPDALVSTLRIVLTY